MPAQGSPHDTVSVVEFPSEGLTLRGRLYRPAHAAGPLPVVVMAHGFSATITGMTADDYAEAFQAAGMAALLYDHRSFGLSDGAPRQAIEKWAQARGYRAAVDFVTARPDLDAACIALWGDSLSGAEVLAVAAVDERVAAVVAQVPACGDEPAPPDPHGRGFESLRDTLLHADLERIPRTALGPMPVVSSDPAAPSLLEPLTAFRWFIEYGGRFGTGWENRATLVNLSTDPPFHAGLFAPRVTAPLLMLVARGDEMPGCDEAVARSVFAAVPAAKELIEIDGGHFGLLQSPGALLDDAIRAQVRFLKKHLLRLPSPAPS